MAFVSLVDNAKQSTVDLNYEYNNSPTDPGVGSPLRPLWQKQTNGIRTDGGHEVYTEVRKVGTTTSIGEISKTWYDALVARS